jgi:3-polyprenyl-4-hydroxybenzoate decarboxylase
MIGFYRMASIAPGKLPHALAFAREIAAHIKDKHGVELSIAMPIGGNPFRIGWSTRYESLAVMEEKQGAMMGDPRYVELVVQGAELFIAGSVHDEVWKIL